MLLKNFGSFLATIGGKSAGMGIVTTSDVSDDSISKYLLINKFTGTFAIPYNQYYINTAMGTPTSFYYTILFGDGDTPPTINDNKLSGNFLSYGLITSSSSVVSNGSDGFRFNAVIQNTYDSTNMTIKEIGLGIMTKNSANSGIIVMLTRDVLDSPVILEPSATKGFEIFIDTQSFVTSINKENI